MCHVNVVNRISCFALYFFLRGDWGWLWQPWPPLATPLWSSRKMLSYSNRRMMKQAVGGRPPRYAPPRPATEARSGNLEPGRPSRARSANTRHPAGRPHTPPADRMYATDVKQTDVRQHHRLMPSGRGHNKSLDKRVTAHQCQYCEANLTKLMFLVKDDTSNFT